jgi:6-phosphogluconolactonase
MKYSFFLLLTIFSLQSCAQKYALLVGTYDAANSSGIFVYDFDKKTGATTLQSNAVLPNASYLAISPNQKYVYAVSEKRDSAKLGGGKIAAFSFNKSAKTLTKLNDVSTMGNNPCHITTDNTGNFVVAANYSSGNFVMYSTTNDGSLHELKENIQHKGKSKDTTRQKEPHAHGAFFYTDYTQLYITDLGIDKTMCYQFENGKLKPHEIPSLNEKPGNGPRHLAIHPTGKYMYVLNELNGTISTYFRYNDSWEFLGTTFTEAPTYTGASSAAAIVISNDGKFVYTSNRATANDIAIFSCDPKSGALQLVAHQSSLGLKPRNINLDPTNQFLLVGNQDSNSIIVFKRDKKTGLLTDTNQNITVAKPACIQWIEQ